MSITVKKMNVLAFTVTGAERLDPVRVMIENIEPGKGLLTIACFGESWNSYWGGMGGGTVQEFIKRVSNDYLIGCLDRQLNSTVDDDNDANLQFVRAEIIKQRREGEIHALEAREMWDEADGADDVKSHCCDHNIGNALLNLFGHDEPWHAPWPSVPNPKYQYLDRIINAVRYGLRELEAAQ